MTTAQGLIAATVFLAGWAWRALVWMPRERGPWESIARKNSEKRKGWKRK